MTGAGWYTDPLERAPLRYWDGQSWRPVVKRQGNILPDLMLGIDISTLPSPGTSTTQDRPETSANDEATSSAQSVQSSNSTSTTEKEQQYESNWASVDQNGSEPSAPPIVHTSPDLAVPMSNRRFDTSQVDTQSYELSLEQNAAFSTGESGYSELNSNSDSRSATDREEQEATEFWSLPFNAKNQEPAEAPSGLFKRKANEDSSEHRSRMAEMAFVGFGALLVLVGLIYFFLF